MSYPLQQKCYMWFLRLGHKNHAASVWFSGAPSGNRAAVMRVSSHTERPSVCSRWEPQLSPSSESCQPDTTHGSEETSRRPPSQPLESPQLRPRTPWSRDKPLTKSDQNPWSTETTSTLWLLFLATKFTVSVTQPQLLQQPLQCQYF